MSLVDGELTATFVPSAGMLCRSLTHRGEELLAQNEGVEAYAAAGKTMGVPLLYPWANRLGGFAYEFDGRAVSLSRDPALVAVDGNGLPIHGVVPGHLSWQPADDANDRSLTAVLDWNGGRDAFSLFPFEHTATYTAALADGRLEIAVSVRATGATRVPVSFGFHPYIELPDVERAALELELPALDHLSVDARQIPTGASRASAPERFALGDRVYDDGFAGARDRTSFAVSGGGRRVSVELSSGYALAQVYAPAGRRFVCFEPMTAPANALVSGDGLRAVSPGEQFAAVFRIDVGAAD